MGGYVFYLALAVVYHCGGVCLLKSMERPGFYFHNIADTQSSCKHQSPYSGLILQAVLYCIIFSSSSFFYNDYHINHDELPHLNHRVCVNLCYAEHWHSTLVCVCMLLTKNLSATCICLSPLSGSSPLLKPWRCLWTAHLLAITVTSTSIFPLNPSHPS